MFIMDGGKEITSEADLSQSLSLTIKVSLEVLHVLVAMLNFIQVRCVGAFHQSERKRPDKTMNFDKKPKSLRTIEKILTN